MYSSAIIGVAGRRARGHAQAYPLVARARLLAVSSRTAGRATDFANEFGVPRAFTDHREMLEVTRPDVVHLNTPPTARLSLLRDCEAAGVKGVVVEKPVAVDGADYLELLAFSRTTSLRVVVNHQLQFHPRRVALAEIVNQGRVGHLTFIDASAGDTMAYQGTHTLQAMMSFAGNGVRQVFATASGPEGLQANVAHHFAPDACVGQVDFDGGLSALFRCGSNAPRVDTPAATAKFHHKRISVYGELGQVSWSMWGWRTLVDGKLTTGSHDYYAEDQLAQAALVDALCEWIDGKRTSHPLNLARALQEFEVQLALYTSSIDRQLVRLPFTPRPTLINELRHALS